MIKIAVLDDYQNIFEEFIDIDKHKDKFEFTIFNEPFQSETEVNEAPPKMKNSKEVDNIIKTMAVVSGLQKGGMASRYGNDFLKAKRRALKAINDMLTYA